MTGADGRSNTVAPPAGRAAGCRKAGPASPAWAAGLLAAVAVVGDTGPLAAADWRVTPYVQVREAFTDNVRGVGDNTEADLISTGTAGVSIRGDGARVRLGLDYELSYDKYIETTEFDGMRHRGLALGEAELVDDQVFFDARGAVSERSIRRTGASTATDRLIDGNRTRVVNLSAGPTLRHPIGTFADAEARYRYSRVSFMETAAEDDTGTGTGVSSTGRPDDSDGHDFLAALTSGRDFTRLPWQAIVEHIISDRSGGERTETVGSLRGEYKVNRLIALIAGAGYEHIEDVGSAFDADGPTWVVGVRLTPSERTQARVEYGRRYDDQIWSGELRHQFATETTVVATWRETVATEQQLLSRRLAGLTTTADGTIIDPDTGLASDPNATDLDLVDETVRQKSFAASLVSQRGRNRYVATAFHTTRERAAEDSDERLVGARLGYDRRLTPTLDLAIALAASRTIETSGNQGQDTTWTAQASLTHAFNPTLKGSLEYVYRRQVRDDAADVSENAILAVLRKEF